MTSFRVVQRFVRRAVASAAARASPKLPRVRHQRACNEAAAPRAGRQSPKHPGRKSGTRQVLHPALMRSSPSGCESGAEGWVQITKLLTADEGVAEVSPSKDTDPKKLMGSG